MKKIYTTPKVELKAIVKNVLSGSTDKFVDMDDLFNQGGQWE